MSRNVQGTSPIQWTHLKTRPQFQEVLGGGVLVRTQHFALHHLTQAQQAPALFAGADCWLGAMVPKRWAKRAVTRNTIKRQIYAVSAEQAQSLQATGSLALVVRMRAGWSAQLYRSATSEQLRRDVRVELQDLLAQAAKRLGAIAAGGRSPA